MSTFSFRAECASDIDALVRRLDKLKIGHTLTKGQGPVLARFDVPVEVAADVSLERLQWVVRSVPDGHVMLQTLKECKLGDNDLQRDFDLL